MRVCLKRMVGLFKPPKAPDTVAIDANMAVLNPNSERLYQLCCDSLTDSIVISPAWIADQLKKYATPSDSMNQGNVITNNGITWIKTGLKHA